LPIVLEFIGNRRATFILLEELVLEFVPVVGSVILEGLRSIKSVYDRISGSEGGVLAILEGAVLEGVPLEVPVVVRERTKAFSLLEESRRGKSDCDIVVLLLELLSRSNGC